MGVIGLEARVVLKPGKPPEPIVRLIGAVPTRIDLLEEVPGTKNIETMSNIMTVVVNF